MRLDAHTSFLEDEKADYPPWNGKEKLTFPYLPGDFKPLVHSIRFDGVIAVQARESLKETNWLLQLAEQFYIIKGVVGWVDLCSPLVEQQLDQYAQNDFLKGIRYSLKDKKEDDFLLSNPFQNGIRLLTEYNLTFDLLMNERHLPYVTKLIDKHPDQQFVIDHLSLPQNQKQMLEEWTKHMSVISTFENVYCKISPTREELHLESYLPYLEKVVELFPSERLMVGSNWPYYSIQTNYESVMTFIFDFIRNLPRENQADILGLTCKKFYKLDL